MTPDFWLFVIMAVFAAVACLDEIGPKLLRRKSGDWLCSTPPGAVVGAVFVLAFVALVVWLVVRVVA